MNIVLFSDDEWGKPIASVDYRTVHIRNHLHLAEGDSLRVGCLNRGTGTAVISNLGNADLPLVLEFPQNLISWNFSPLVLIAGHPRPLVFQRILRDLASFGISEMCFVLTELGEKSYFKSSLWQPKLLAQNLMLGLEQGGHSFLPIVQRQYSLQTALENLGDRQGSRNNSFRISLEPKHNSPSPSLIELLHESHPQTAGQDLVLAIGPDRGWTQTELDMLHSESFHSANLGKTIHRSEVAILLACGICRMFYD